MVKVSLALLDRLSKTPHSLIKLPNIKKPTSDTDSGARSPATIVIAIGKIIFVPFETCFGLYSIFISLSRFDVQSLITKGCTKGTRAI